MPVCERHCDHCYPEALHRCALPKGHGGYCSCDPTTTPTEGDER